MISRWLTTLFRPAPPGRPPRTAPPRTFLRLEGLEGREMLSTVSVEAPGWWSPTNDTDTVEARVYFQYDRGDSLPDVFGVRFGPQASVGLFALSTFDFTASAYNVVSVDGSHAIGRTTATLISPAPVGGTPPATPAPNTVEYPDSPASPPAAVPPRAGGVAAPNVGQSETGRSATTFVVTFGERQPLATVAYFHAGDAVAVAPPPRPSARPIEAPPPTDVPPLPLPGPVTVSPTPAPAPASAPVPEPAAIRGAQVVGGTAATIAPPTNTPAAQLAPTVPTAPASGPTPASAAPQPAPAAAVPVVADVGRAAASRESLATQTDAALVRRFVTAGEQAAFTELVRRYGPTIQATCARILGDADRARDAAQATFLALARRAHALDDRGSLAGWLHQVARRMALRHRATVARYRRLEKVAAELREDPDDTLMAVEAQDLLWALREELARLPEKYRIPLTLCYLDGRTHAEVAQEVGLPRGSVAKRIGEGLARLRDGLNSRGISS
jgi:RNA polymerase sigma factor (sigma-70 family)